MYATPHLWTEKRKKRPFCHWLPPKIAAQWNNNKKNNTFFRQARTLYPKREPRIPRRMIIVVMFARIVDVALGPTLVIIWFSYTHQMARANQFILRCRRHICERWVNARNVYTLFRRQIELKKLCCTLLIFATLKLLSTLSLWSFVTHMV